MSFKSPSARCPGAAVDAGIGGPSDNILFGEHTVAHVATR